MTNLKMPAYFLLARETVVAVPLTVIPVAVVVRLAATDMHRREVSCQGIARREVEAAVNPFAHVGVRGRAVVLGCGGQWPRRRHRRRGRVARGLRDRR